jgi:hypothetical protein
MTQANTLEQQTIQTMEIHQQISIAASLDVSFQALLAQLGPEGQMPDGTSLSMKLEAWPGGRWYRDLGNNAGHLWAHVQVIKPPALLELYGPMPMPYPAVNHIQFRLAAEGAGSKAGATTLKLVHKAMGMIPQEHRDGMPAGWEDILKRIRQRAERR